MAGAPAYSGGAEISRELFAGALESEHGTAIAAPAVTFNGMGSILPERTDSRRSRMDGRRSEYYQTAVVRQEGVWTLDDSDLDVNTLPFLAEMLNGPGTHAVVAGSVSGHEYIGDSANADVKSATLFFGDQQWSGGWLWQMPYSLLDELSISSDASGTDASTMAASGRGQWPEFVEVTDVAPPTAGPLIVGGWMELFVDTGASPIGTTLVNCRLISAEHTWTTNTSYKHLACGPGVPLGFSLHGLGKFHLETVITAALLDDAETALFRSATPAKVRVRHNGPLLDATNYAMVEVDTYGPLSDMTWETLEDTNRAVSFTIYSEVDPTLDGDWRLFIQNLKAGV